LVAFFKEGGYELRADQSAGACDEGFHK
jgi:hypothetical protein